MKIKEKLKALAGAVTDIEKQFGQGAVMYLGKAPCVADIPSFSTGSIGLDLAVGPNGYPRGRLVEIYGPESSGKTTLTLHAIAEMQKQEGVCAFIDAEHALDVTYARKLGVNVDNLLVSQPDHGEQALEITDTLIGSGAVDLVVIDSVAALAPKAELEGEMGDHHVGLQARMMAKAMRKLTAVTHRTNTTIIFINQTRQKIGVTFGSPETTTGGNALKFFASLRLDIRKIGKIKDPSKDNEIVGNRTRVKVVKNKLAPPFREVEFEIRFGKGIHQIAEVFDLAVAKGIITKSGAHYSMKGERIGHGRDKSQTYLSENLPILEEIISKLRNPEEEGKDKRAKESDEKAA